MNVPSHHLVKKNILLLILIIKVANYYSRNKIVYFALETKNNNIYKVFLFYGKRVLTLPQGTTGRVFLVSKYIYMKYTLQGAGKTPPHTKTLLGTYQTPCEAHTVTTPFVTWTP